MVVDLCQSGSRKTSDPMLCTSNNLVDRFTVYLTKLLHNSDWAVFTFSYINTVSYYTIEKV